MAVPHGHSRPRLALVTGGAGGLGSAQAAALLAAGHDVLILDRDEPATQSVCRDLRARFPARTIAAQCVDLAEIATIEDTLTASGRASEVAVLVNNAGYATKQEYSSIHPDELMHMFCVNAAAAFRLGQLVAPGMKARGFGRIINIGSATLAGFLSEFSPYVMSKGALLGMTRALARELGADGITVNLINPGAVATAAELAVWGTELETFNANILAHQSVKRRLSADDVGALTAFLASDSASMVTGQAITIDGGWYMT